MRRTDLHTPDRTTRRGERGESLLEFAFASVIFFLVVFGTLEFGHAIWQYNLVSDLAQEGARWASVRGSTSSSPASAADVQTFVRSRAYGLNVTVTTAPVPSTMSGNGTNTVAVTVQQNFSLAVPFLSSSTIPMSSTARMVMSR